MPPIEQPSSKRIHLLRTEGEWDYLKKLVLEKKHCDLHTYLHREISRLSSQYAACEVCVTPASGDLKSYRHNIPTSIYNQISMLAEKMNKPIATVIDDYLIMPLLLLGKDAVGQDFL